MLQRRSIALLALFLVLCMAGVARAGTEGEGVDKTVTATRAERAPSIDGRLTEELWRGVEPDDRFTQLFPTDGAAPTMRTTVRIAFDAHNLYFGVEALDPEPGKVSARLARRDSLIDSDYLEFFLDTRHSHDSGYWFRINAAGVLADGELYDDGRINYDWNGVWRGQAAITDSGWSAEIAIPLSILRFHKSSSPLFGFNVKRGIRRLGEIDQWIYVPRTSSGTLSRAGHINGLEGIAPRRVVELRPFAVGRVESVLPAGGSAALGDGEQTIGASAGLDAKIGVGAGLTLDATINPDFGQVEADPVVLNLTSFENFFSERRPFYLEGAGLFALDIRLINSRRIGQRTHRFGAGSTVVLQDNRSVVVEDTPLAVPTYGALRLSGRTGALSLNVLSALTGPETATVREEGGALETAELGPARSYNVARAKYALGGSSYIGAAATGRVRLGTGLDPNTNHDAFAESIDGRWVRSDGMYRLYFQVATAHRHGGDVFAEGDRNCNASSDCRPHTRLDGTIVGPGDIGSAGEIGGSKAGGALRTYNRYRWVSPRFDVDALGFENDWDYHELVTSNSAQREKSFGWFERGQVAVDASTQYAFDGTRKHLGMGLSASALTKGFWRGDISLDYKPPGNFTARESLDGAYFERSDELFASFDIESDSRLDTSGGFGASYLHSPKTERRAESAYAFGTIRPTPPLELNLQTSISQSRGRLRVVQCTADDGVCWRRSSVRDYLLALQDSQSLNITARVSWSLSTTLSFEGYLQVFAAGGAFRDYREVLGLAGSRPFIRRRDTRTVADPEDDSSFSFATLTTNLVTRWEFTPGTTLMAVYTRAQEHSRQRNRLATSGLRTGPGNEVFLLKLTYFYNR